MRTARFLLNAHRAATSVARCTSSTTAFVPRCKNQLLARQYPSCGLAYRRFSSSHAKADTVQEFITKGNEHIEAGRPQQAIECYVDAIAEQGEAADLLYNLGSAYCQAGRVMDAMVTFRKSLEMDSAQPDAIVNLANLYASQGNTREAIKLYNEALELRPNDAQCLHNLGLIYSKTGDWSAAVKALKKSIDIDSEMPMEPLKYALIRMVSAGGSAPS